MTSYRRNFVPGGSFFFTVNLADRKLSLLTTHVEILRAAFRETRQRHPFTIDAIVILPDHLHAIWTIAGGRRELRNALASDQINLLSQTWSRRIGFGEPGRQGGAWYLAASLLGAHHPG